MKGESRSPKSRAVYQLLAYAAAGPSRRDADLCGRCGRSCRRARGCGFRQAAQCRRARFDRPSHEHPSADRNNRTADRPHGRPTGTRLHQLMTDWDEDGFVSSTARLMRWRRCVLGSLGAPASARVKRPGQLEASVAVGSARPGGGRCRVGTSIRVRYGAPAGLDKNAAIHPRVLASAVVSRW
jgi:hypothetical protein